MHERGPDVAQRDSQFLFGDASLGSGTVHDIVRMMPARCGKPLQHPHGRFVQQVGFSGEPAVHRKHGAVEALPDDAIGQTVDRDRQAIGPALKEFQQVAASIEVFAEFLPTEMTKPD